MISVIIPTFNRGEILIKTLLSLEKQNFPISDFEVIIVDDGSADDTKSKVLNFFKKTNLRIRYFYQENSGPAKARNFGIEKAQGDILLFSGDDMIFDKDNLRKHNFWHKKYKNKAVLGIALWDKSINPDSYMNFLAPSGPQFRYNSIKNINDAGFNHFYTCNISLNKKWFEKSKFDTNFEFAAFEDIDLGLALEKNGLKIFYDKSAIVYHSHYYDQKSFCKRMYLTGRSFVTFKKKYAKDSRSLFKIYYHYAPFEFFPFGTWFLYSFSNVLRKSKLIYRFSKKINWLSNISYFYSKGIIYQKNLYNSKQ